MINRIDTFFERYKGYATVFLRLIIGWRLISGTQDNIFSWERMLEFRDFLTMQGTPLPLLSAIVSVYAQFICGILYMAGWFIRPAALVMIVNFIAALLIAHIGQSFEQSFEALVILASSIFFLFNGAGRISGDGLRNKQKLS